MMSEILAGNGSEHDGVYLSVTHLPKNLLEHFAEDYFPGPKSVVSTYVNLV